MIVPAYACKQRDTPPTNAIGTYQHFFDDCFSKASVNGSSRTITLVVSTTPSARTSKPSFGTIQSMQNTLG